MAQLPTNEEMDAQHGIDEDCEQQQGRTLTSGATAAMARMFLELDAPLLAAKCVGCAAPQQPQLEPLSADERCEEGRCKLVEQRDNDEEEIERHHMSSTACPSQRS